MTSERLGTPTGSTKSPIVSSSQHNLDLRPVSNRCRPEQRPTLVGIPDPPEHGRHHVPAAGTDIREREESLGIAGRHAVRLDGGHHGSAPDDCVATMGHLSSLTPEYLSDLLGYGRRGRHQVYRVPCTSDYPSAPLPQEDASLDGARPRPEHGRGHFRIEGGRSDPEHRRRAGSRIDDSTTVTSALMESSSKALGGSGLEETPYAGRSPGAPRPSSNLWPGCDNPRLPP